MMIHKIQKGTELYIAPVGEVDAITAPELQKAIQESIQGMTSVILDFEKVDYISSAGLRTILLTEQIMEEQGQLKLIHVNDMIYEILDLTGLSDFLTIERRS